MQEELIFQFNFKDKKKPMSEFDGNSGRRNSPKLGVWSASLLYLGLQIIGRGSPILETHNLLYSIYLFNC